MLRGAATILAVMAALLVLVLPSRATAAEVLVHVRVQGVINPVKARLVERAVARAEQERAAVLLVSIDTPGGLVTSMQDIVGALTNTGVPVVTIAEPRSAQATSAGAFILLAGDVAAMAPGTRVGAAHPVAAGKPLEGHLDAKATNDLTSLIRSLAERSGRPAAPAEAMVRESTSYTAEQALEKKLIELVVAHEGELLDKLHGRELAPGRRLHTRGLRRVEVSASKLEVLLDHLADPTLTSLLLSLGMLALLYELASPGIGAGGALGAVMLVLGLLGSSVLPLELSGLLLLVVGFVAIALEFKLPTYGFLGGSGLLAVVLGGLLLVDPDDYFGGMRGVNPWLFVPIVLAAALGLVFVGRLVRKTMAEPSLTGTESLVGRLAVARSTFGREQSETVGHVFVDGALWPAQGDEPRIERGEQVRIVAVSSKPTRLIVRREG